MYELKNIHEMYTRRPNMNFLRKAFEITGVYIAYMWARRQT